MCTYTYIGKCEHTRSEEDTSAARTDRRESERHFAFYLFIQNIYLIHLPSISYSLTHVIITKPTNPFFFRNL